MGYRVEVRDKDLTRIGEIDTWTQLEFVVRYSNSGTWQLLVKDGTEQARMLEQGRGIAIWQDGVDKPVLTGSIDRFEKYWTTQQHTEQGSIYVGGYCDNQIVYDYIAFPEPTLPVDEQYKGKANRGVNAAAGVAIWNEFNWAFGPGALPDRQATGMSLGQAPAIGDVVVDNLRFDWLGSTIEGWSKNKGVGYRLLWNPDTKKIDLDLYTPRDKSKDVRFSTELGNIRQYSYTLTAPKVTRVIVAAQGEGKERYLYQAIDSEAEAEWGVRKERFEDRRDLPVKRDLTTGQAVKATAETTDQEFQDALTAIEEEAAGLLKWGERVGRFQIYPIDTPQCAFGRDYFVGDIVTVIADGTEYVDLVREVNITVDSEGQVNVSPKIGEQGTEEPLNLYASVSEMRKKLARLEARM